MQSIFQDLLLGIISKGFLILGIFSIIILMGGQGGSLRKERLQIYTNWKVPVPITICSITISVNETQSSYIPVYSLLAIIQDPSWHAGIIHGANNKINGLVLDCKPITGYQSWNQYGQDHFPELCTFI